MELRAVGVERPHLDLPGGGDVDHEGGLERIVLHVGEVRRRPVRRAGAAARQAGVEAGGSDQRMGALVIGMAVDGRRPEDELGAQPAQDLDHLVLLLRAGAQGAVAQGEEFELLGAEDLRRLRRFALALGGRAARPRLARGQVQDADPAPRPRHLRERSAAADFDVVGVRPDRQHVDGHACTPSPPATSTGIGSCARAARAKLGRWRTTGTSAANASSAAPPAATSAPPRRSEQRRRRNRRAPARDFARRQPGAAIEKPANVRKPPDREERQCELDVVADARAAEQESDHGPHREQELEDRWRRKAGGRARVVLPAVERRIGGLVERHVRRPPARALEEDEELVAPAAGAPRHRDRARLRTARSPTADSSWRAGG